MRALTVIPGKANSAAISDMPDPSLEYGSILVKTIAVGVCGTDIEIVSGQYGWLPEGQDKLILGHESLGEVVEAPEGSGFAKGDHIVGIVRRPDPVPCIACAGGEWDMCRNGQYTERGIKQRHGFASEHFRIEPDYAIKLDPALGIMGVLLEPTSVVAKAWDHIERIGRRAIWQPKTVLITGAGPIGLLAAMISVQRGYDTHVLDKVADGPKPDLVKELGATYHTGKIDDLGFRPEIVVECTGVSALIVDSAIHMAPDGIVCLCGVSSAGQKIELDMGTLNREMVLENDVIFGSVNANRTHWQMAADALAKADKTWLGKLISRRETLDNWQAALKREPTDIKVIIDFTK
jgi:threonine dehydrogenase-like Zn-dependent dehydrogenase